MKEISNFHSQTVQIKVACKLKVCCAIISYKWWPVRTIVWKTRPFLKKGGTFFGILYKNAKKTTKKQ